MNERGNTLNPPNLKVLHLISGGDKGGAKTHVFALLTALNTEIDARVVCFMEGVFYQEIKNMPISSMLIRQRYRNDLTIIPKLVKFIREERFDLIHAHGARGNFIAVLLRPFIKIPMITTMHSDYRLDFTENIYKKMVFTELNSASLRFLDYFIGVSQNFTDMLISRQFPKDRVYTVYNAIDFKAETPFVPKAQFLKKYGIEAEGKTLIGIIGRFDKVKGHEVFLQAAAKALEKRDDLLFLLAGEGVEQHSLMQLTKSLGISQNVKFIGFVNDIFSFINAIDINVLSSHSESFPYVLLEGAKMSKATISTAVGGIPDLIIHGETGLLADDNDYQTMGNHMAALASDPTLRARLGNNLQTFAKENFSTDIMKKRHIEIYRDVLRRQKEKGLLFDVILSGYYGFNNSGDDAILSAIIDSLRREKPDVSLLVLSKNPKATAKQHGVVSLSRINFLQIAAYMKRCRLFINGGGSLIQDITSTHSLYYYTLLMYLSKKYGLKLMLFANGIGPIIRRSNEGTARKALQMCDYITLRDPQSFDELARLGVKNENVALSSDPTLAIKPAEGAELMDILAYEGISLDKKYVALSFRQWKYNDSDFTSKMSAVINELNKSYGLIPLFVPMQHPFDGIISREIAAKLTCDHVILKREYDVCQLMGIAGIADIMVGMRLHSLIYAVSMGVPVIGIVYDPKIKAFMDYIGQPYYLDNQNVDAAELIKTFGLIMHNIENIRESITIEGKKLRALSGKDASIAIELLK